MSREEVITSKDGEVNVLRRSLRSSRAPKTFASEQSELFEKLTSSRKGRGGGPPKKKKKEEDEMDEENEEVEESSDEEDFEDGKRSRKKKPARNRKAKDEEDEEDEEEEGKKKKKKRSTKKRQTKRKKKDEEDDEDEGGEKKSKRKPPKKKQKKDLHFEFDPEYVQNLRESFPDDYWLLPKNQNMINLINEDNPLKHIQSLSQPGTIYCLSLSPFGDILATGSNLGTIRLWDTEDWTMLSEIIDTEEKEIDEFYVLSWTKDGKHIIAAGKRKSRSRWSSEDEDNGILECPIKIFDVLSGKTVARLKGHTEEVFCIKKLSFQGKNYLLSSSEDGRFIRWEMNDDFTDSLGWEYVNDLTTNVAISFSFVPNTGNKYFVASCDDGVKLFDFEALQLVASWPGKYSSVCDCVKFVDAELFNAQPNEFYFVSKGAELVTEKNEDEVMYPNKCLLHKLTMPTEKKGEWKLEDVGTFTDKTFKSNLWYLKFTSNGRYLVAPTTTGQTFIWTLKTQELVGVVEGHPAEIRDIIFHPLKPLLITCGDGAEGSPTVRIYKSCSKKEYEQKKKEMMAQVEQKKNEPKKPKKY